MNETSLSLLDRVCSGSQDEAWQRLVDVYAPLLRQWLRKYDFQATDADDLVQEVMATAFRELPKFEHNGRQGAFRNWLKTILIYRMKSFWRDRQYRPSVPGGTDFQRHVQEFEDPASELSRLWDREHDRVVLQQLWEAIRPRFSEKTCAAFRRQVIDGMSAADVAAELEISVNAVLIAKSRVLKDLRREGRGILED
jgi:RNA polymerase sigma-70 factor (ECF subfamily)